MPTELIIVLVLTAIIIWMNIRATLLIFHDDLSEPRQRLFQLLMVWLLPMLGAILVFAVHRPAEKPSGKYREDSEPVEDIGIHRYGARGRSNDGGDDD